MASDPYGTFNDMAMGISKAKLGGEIISQTLDALNSNTCTGESEECPDTDQSMSDTYNLSKSVLSAAYLDKGALVSSKS